jgi:hypothetical protein
MIRGKRRRQNIESILAPEAKQLEDDLSKKKPIKLQN